MSLFWLDNEVKFNSWSIYLVVKSHVFRARNSNGGSCYEY